MSVSQLLAALQAVPQHFSTAAGSQPAAQQALATARRLLKAAQPTSQAELSTAWHTLERWVHSCCLAVLSCRLAALMLFDAAASL